MQLQAAVVPDPSSPPKFPSCLGLFIAPKCVKSKNQLPFHTIKTPFPHLSFTSERSCSLVQALRLEGQVMIWVGEEAVLGTLAMAVPVADCPSTQVSCDK